MIYSQLIEPVQREMIVFYASDFVLPDPWASGLDMGWPFARGDRLEMTTDDTRLTIQLETCG